MANLGSKGKDCKFQMNYFLLVLQSLCFCKLLKQSVFNQIRDLSRTYNCNKKKRKYVVENQFFLRDFTLDLMERTAEGLMQRI